jgi:hypothetical protein
VLGAELNRRCAACNCLIDDGQEVTFSLFRIGDVVNRQFAAQFGFTDVRRGHR